MLSAYKYISYSCRDISDEQNIQPGCSCWAEHPALASLILQITRINPLRGITEKSGKMTGKTLQDLVQNSLLKQYETHNLTHSNQLKQSKLLEVPGFQM